MPLIKPKATVHFSEVYGEGALLDMDKGRYLRLNRIATLMWNAMLKASTQAELMALLIERIDADELTLTRATQDFLHQISEAGLVTDMQNVT